MKTFSGIGIALAAALAAAPLAIGQSAQAPRARSAGSAMQMVTYLGVAGEDLEPDRRQALRVKEDHGIVVTMVTEGAPAEKAGLKPGDVILEFSGRAVESFDQLRGLIQDSAPGKPVKLLVSRNGVNQTLTAMPELRRMVIMPGLEIPMPAMPMPMPAPAAPMAMPPMVEIPRFQTLMPNSMLGILGEDLMEEPQFAEFFGVKDGVLVKAVTANSPADRAGVKAGDVLIKVEDRRVASARELQRMVRAEQAKSSFPVTVVRNRKELVVSVSQ